MTKETQQLPLSPLEEFIDLKTKDGSDVESEENRNDEASLEAVKYDSSNSIKPLGKIKSKNITNKKNVKQKNPEIANQMKTKEKERLKKYVRGNPPSKSFYKAITDKKLLSTLKRTEKNFQEYSQHASRVDMLLLEKEAGYLVAEGMEKTYKFSQHKLRDHLDLQTQSKLFDLDLKQMGPYCFDYTRNGRYLLLAGKKGHIALMDWVTKKLFTEIHVKETVRDVKFLHNETLFVASQRKYVYMYDKQGVEIHRLEKHIDTNKLEFLPYHFLLVSVGNAGYLKYQDVSTGQLVAEMRTKFGSCNAMRQNPRNAIIGLGHHNGIVTMWSPNLSTPLVKMLCHRAPVKAIAFDTEGNSMVTAGLDGQVKIWDIRNYKMLYQYRSHPPTECLDISQRGLLAVGGNSNGSCVVQVWKDAFRMKQTHPYIEHRIIGSSLRDVHFCPYEDIMGLGHSNGFSSVVIPGSGEPNFDTFERNPFETKKQRKEIEVRALLEKLPSEMITLNPDFVGGVNRSVDTLTEEEKDLSSMKNNTENRKKIKSSKGKSLTRRLRSKQSNIWDEKRVAWSVEQEKKRKQKEELQNYSHDKLGRENTNSDLQTQQNVLDRFKRKRVKTF